jgi:hypothetical protein
MTKNTTERKRKSELLTKEEHAAFRKLYNSFHTKVDAEDYFGIKRQVLDQLVLKGSASSDTVAAVREKLGSPQTV